MDHGTVSIALSSFIRSLRTWLGQALIVTVPLMAAGCNGGYVYYKAIGPLAWSNDGKTIYFVFDDHTTDAVYSVNLDGPDRPPRKVWKSNSKVDAVQALDDRLWVSSGHALEVSLSDSTAMPLTIAGVLPKAAFKIDSQRTVYVTPETTDKKSSLSIINNAVITQIDQGPIDVGDGFRFSLSPDRKHLIFVGKQYWSIAATNPPYVVQYLKSGSFDGWITSDLAEVQQSRDCPGICNWDPSGGLRQTTFPHPEAVYMQPSPDSSLVAFCYAEKATWSDRVMSIAVCKPDGSDYRVVLDGNLLPRGPAVLEIRPS